jgi:tRNA U38,U39,U40 pseudouridine synthase TruA
MRDYYNSCIPDDIRIFSVKRVTRKFHAMFLANLRLWDYVAPLVLFVHKDDKYDLD